MNTAPASSECPGTAQVGGLRDRISKREERHSDGPLVWPGAEFHGEHFWARGYAVSTLGLELEQVRKYIREPEAADGNRGSF